MAGCGKETGRGVIWVEKRCSRAAVFHPFLKCKMLKYSYIWYTQQTISILNHMLATQIITAKWLYGNQHSFMFP